MSFQDILEILQAGIIFGSRNLTLDISMVVCSDLMSDVLAYSKRGSLLLTGLTNPQSVRTAEMSELVAVCYVRGKLPQAETIQLARHSNIPLVGTGYSMYEAAGRLFQGGLSGGHRSG